MNWRNSGWWIPAETWWGNSSNACGDPPRVDNVVRETMKWSRRMKATNWIAIGITAVIQLTGTAFAQPSAAPAADEPALPMGFALAGKSDAGRALVCLKDDVKSAQKMLTMTVADLSGYFDGRPAVESAYGDKDDRSAMTSFRATLSGKGMRGTIFASVGAKGGTSTVVFDREDAPAAALGRLAAAAVPIGNMKWAETRIPDGSGTLSLPEHWKFISAGNGALDVAGPDGQTISLGIAYTIFTPQAEAAFHQQRAQLGLPPAPSGFLVAPFSDPAEAVKTLLPQFSKMSEAGRQPSYRLLSIIETTPLEDRLGRTAYVHLLVEIRRGEATLRQEGLALIKCMPMAGGRWQYYFSQVTAPEALFQRDLPTMARIWQSWKLDPNSVRERMNQALAVMAQTRDMLKHSAEYQDRVRAQSSAEWDSIITGYATIVDKATGQQIDKNAANVKDTINKLNEKAGYEQFKEISLRDR